jgi:hypothetical protein
LRARILRQLISINDSCISLSDLVPIEALAASGSSAELQVNGERKLRP